MVRWGIVGFGDIAAKAVAPAIQAHKSSSLEAICRRDKASLDRYARDFNVPRTYTDYTEMLDAGGLTRFMSRHPSTSTRRRRMRHSTAACMFS